MHYLTLIAFLRRFGARRGGENKTGLLVGAPENTSASENRTRRWRFLGELRVNFAGVELVDVLRIPRGIFFNSLRLSTRLTISDLYFARDKLKEDKEEARARRETFGTIRPSNLPSRTKLFFSFRQVC